MKTVGWGTGWLTVALLLGAAPTAPAAGQSLADRVAGKPDGVVTFTFEVRDDVLVCDDGISAADGSRRWGGWDSDRRRRSCVDGPVQVEVESREGRVRDLEFGVPGSVPGATEVGEVAPRAAVDFLLGLARSAARDEAAAEGMMLATLALDVDVAPELLGLARDGSLDRGVRKGALFWVSQVAADRIGPHLAGIAADEAEDQEVRDAAVFALSQRPADEAIPVLMELARTAPHAKTRKSSLFWLAQMDDPRVPEFFAELILGEGG